MAKPNKTKIKLHKTQRGFKLGEFKDTYGEHCTIQESSNAEEARIWLGVHAPLPKMLVNGQGWVAIHLPETVMLHGRMHLNQEQVKALLPLLERFAETGKL